MTKCKSKINKSKSDIIITIHTIMHIIVNTCYLSVKYCKKKNNNKKKGYTLYLGVIVTV